LEGQYGKYINAKNKKKRLMKARNIKLPDDVDIKKLTLSDVQKLVSEWKPKRKFYKKGSTTVKRTSKKISKKTLVKKK
jgi:topoisomerase IA-like protein